MTKILFFVLILSSFNDVCIYRDDKRNHDIIFIGDSLKLLDTFSFAYSLNRKIIFEGYNSINKKLISDGILLKAGKNYYNANNRMFYVRNNNKFLFNSKIFPKIVLYADTSNGANLFAEPYLDLEILYKLLNKAIKVSTKQISDSLTEECFFVGNIIRRIDSICIVYNSKINSPLFISYVSKPFFNNKEKSVVKDEFVIYNFINSLPKEADSLLSIDRYLLIDSIKRKISNKPSPPQ